MDRISNLSDDLLLKIVSSLPTKDVVATMVLSKRWRFLWTMLPKLDFDDRFHLEPSKYGMFMKYVDRSLVSHRAPVLETLKFKVGPCCSSEDLATWIRIGMVRHVLEIQCEKEFDAQSSIELPKTLYTYEKLEVLKLAESIILDVPSDVCFPSLKTLHLICVAYKTKESHRMLLSGCPVLEELVLDKTDNWDTLRSLYVEVPNLQRLSILDTYDSPNLGGSGIHKIVISVPSLKYLNFVDFYGDLCLCENMPEVVEANVKVIYESPAKLLESLPSVKRLYLCLSTSMLRHRIGFYHLVHLELCVKSLGWNLLTWMLESSPKLQVLNIGKCEELRRCALRATEGHWRGPSSVPECLMFHLHTFNWKLHSIEDKEMIIVAYILKNARQLKTASISAWKFCSKDEQSQKLSELVSLPRASSSCQLVVESRKSRSIPSRG